MADVDNTGDPGLESDESYEEGQSGTPAYDGEGSEDTSQSDSWTPAQQAAFTRKTQELAEKYKSQEAEFQKQRESWEQEASQRVQTQAQQLARQYLQQYQQQAGQQGQQQQDPLATLRNMEMVDGPTLYQALQHVQQSNYGPLARYAQQLAQQNQYLYQQYGQIAKSVQQAEAEKRQMEFTSLLKSTRDQLGLPEEEWVDETLKDLYLSHQEDAKLREEFPNLAKARVESLQKAFRNLDRQRAQQARSRPFAGSKGSSASPSGKSSDKERYDPKYLADNFFTPETDDEE